MVKILWDSKEKTIEIPIFRGKHFLEVALVLITTFCPNSDYSYHTVLPVVDIDHVAG